MTSKNHPRRKKLREDIRAENRARDRARAAETPANASFWDDLQGMYQASLAMFDGVRDLGAIVSAPVTNANIGPDRDRLLRMSNELIRDVRRYRDSLEAIYAKHSDRRGPESDELEILSTYTIGTDYQQWQDSFQMVVIAKMNDISQILEDMVTRHTTTPTPATTDGDTHDS